MTSLRALVRQFKGFMGALAPSYPSRLPRPLEPPTRSQAVRLLTAHNLAVPVLPVRPLCALEPLPSPTSSEVYDRWLVSDECDPSRLQAPADANVPDRERWEREIAEIQARAEKRWRGGKK